MNDRPSSWIAITGGFIGGIAASTCCILPLVLFSLGITGAWIGNLTDLAAYQPYFIGVSLVCLAIGFHLIYWAKDTCNGNEACKRLPPTRLLKTFLWTAALIVLFASLFPYWAPLLIET